MALLMKRVVGLRRRWLLNTAGVITALGLVCVSAVVASFSAYYYSNMQADMENRARTTTEFFAGYVNQNYNEYYQSCITYAQSFDDRNIEIQFITTDGRMVATSYGLWTGSGPDTPDVQTAVERRGIVPFLGKDPDTGERIMAVSSPMIYSNGEVIGVLRYVTGTRLVDRQIFFIALISFFVLALFLGVVLVTSSFFIGTVMEPVIQITEKAKRIANGSYGSQIQTPYDDEIGELATTINEMSTKISQNEKMQTEFISQLSHELRTPLTVINGWSETLLADEDALDADTRQGLKIISSEAKRLTGLVMELLDFTRMQDGRMTLAVEQTDLRSEFEDTVFMYSSRLAQDGIQLEYLEDDSEIPEISCDAKRLRQVFLNVLDNAAKHGRDGGRIESSISAEDDSVVVRIRDYGPGIPEDEIPLVKKKFYKGSSKARGTGIGLAVCEEIMQMHGGSLTLENAEGGGTLVTIRLPISQ